MRQDATKKEKKNDVRDTDKQNDSTRSKRKKEFEKKIVKKRK